ncbi:MAG TPA: protein kinase [Jatrophihabitans sp.]|nr:protein kinase [Jatrophihabitans sp.]
MSGPWKLRGYVVERLLGAGASGEVWRARVAATGEPVALKRLPPRDAREDRRLHSEAAVLSALEHPNLIRLHAVVPDEQVAGGSVLVLDLAEGGSLAQVLNLRGRLSPGEVVTALAPVAAAVAYAHAQGVLHGDISAANVLFTAEGTALLADLGVARLAGDDHEAESTPAYVDPAVAAGCVPAPSSDVFMLGGVALHALTGSPTWPGSADSALVAARAAALDDVGDRLAQAGVPEPVAGVVARALCPESFRRGTAADFALDLRAAADPVAVELRAGRSRDAVLRGARSAAANAEGGRSRGGRHAAAPPTATRPPLPWRPMAPEPAEPSLPRDPGNSQPPTRAVRARPRPQLPPAKRRRPGLRRLAFSALAVAALALAAVVLLRPPHTGDAAAAGGPAVRSTTPAAPPATPQGGVGRSTVASRAPARSQSPSAPRGDRPAPQRTSRQPNAWAGVLETLDRLRERAYTRRSPGLLRRLYADRGLRIADAAQLVRLVPPGCGLHGVRTHYRNVRAVAVHGQTVRLSATASLPRSRLVCDGRRRATARALAPVPVRIVLARTPSGPRIAGERRLDPS